MHWNISKGHELLKPVQDLIFEKSVHAKPNSKSVKLANNKKEYLDFSLALTNQDKLATEILKNKFFY